MQKFHSKIDWWVLAFLVCMTGLLIQLLLSMQAKGNISAYPLHTATYILTIFIIWWPAINTRYVIDNGKLIIKCMFLKWQIPLEQIHKIETTTNSVASPALSLDRLKLEYTQNGKDKFIIVAPRNKQAFCKALDLNLS
ncbi:PH domain-containing protein [Acinetobacter equi]|uniref:Uncharacterized protein YyaB-like PH domain-containing protein n=1 Tax=Acinetobacter equi TaxID=1324350 RepID=A0A0N9WB13_9GAMM|nr:PH domain-containing protein [Acinetobacter equi]ALH94527.1 hypothetical protein AOY20_02650 [Acinetobacter equi]